MAADEPLPQAFARRRLHSIVGLFLVLFLIEHLFTNSQAALFFGEDGAGFVRMVNWISSLPYLPFIEIFLLGVPFAIHAIWGIQYLFTAESNTRGGTGEKPLLGEYSRNKNYSWQRITSWLILVGLIAHVLQMRFIEYPTKAGHGENKKYMVQLEFDTGLYTLSQRLKTPLLNAQQVQAAQQQAGILEAQGISNKLPADTFLNKLKRLGRTPEATQFNPQEYKAMAQAQSTKLEIETVRALSTVPLNQDQVVALAPNAGTAMLLIIRDTFKSPLMAVLYSVFVLATCFHACNGLWTFLISWGVCLTPRSQNKAQTFTKGLNLFLSALGLMAIWGTYWINLKH